MSDNLVEQFHQFLRDNTKKRSDNPDEQVGLRFLQISREFLEAAALGDLRQNWWLLTKSKLPDDVCLYDIGSSCLLQSIAASNGCYADAWQILLASKEWESVGDGEPIPFIDPPQFTTTEVTNAFQA